MKEIWVLAEISGERIARASAEALSEAVRQARQIRARSTAVVLGYGISDRILEDLRSYGPDRVLLLEDEALAEYSTEVYAHCLAELLLEKKPDVLLLCVSVISRDLAPRLSCRLRCSLVTEATYLNPRQDRYLVTRSAFRPHASMLVIPKTEGLQIVTLAPKVMDIEKTGSKPSCSVDRLATPLPFKKSPLSILERVREIPSKLDLTDAQIIVAGGKGMQSEENFRLLDELAEVLGGTVGASRMAVDAKWRARESMVGVTGKVVSPELYIACGISGAVQHVMGMKSSQTIVAINTDPSAPILRIANLGIVGDTREVLPAMIETLRGIRARAASRETAS